MIIPLCITLVIGGIWFVKNSAESETYEVILQDTKANEDGTSNVEGF